jgi:KDO2-lipid IV(A) lauroyltransferase
VTILANLLLWILSCIPLSWLRGLARVMGWISARLNTESAVVTAANLAHCYPDMDASARARLTEQSLSHTAMLGLEAGVTWRSSVADCLALVQQEQGRELLADAVAADTGVLLLVPHLGNWEFMSPWLCEFGLTALYDPPKIQALDSIIREARERAGIQMLPIDAGGLRRIYQVLARQKPSRELEPNSGSSGGPSGAPSGAQCVANSGGLRSGLVVLLPDQAPGRHAGSVMVPFFGQPAHTMTLVHRLVKRTKPRLLMGGALRVPGGFKVVIEPLAQAPYLESPEAAATAMNESLEAFIAQAPEQYQWEYKRFKRTPLARQVYPKD